MWKLENGVRLTSRQQALLVKLEQHYRTDSARTTVQSRLNTKLRNPSEQNYLLMDPPKSHSSRDEI